MTWIYENAMFVGFDRSRWIQKLDELDRIINENLEQIQSSAVYSRAWMLAEKPIL